MRTLQTRSGRDPNSPVILWLRIGNSTNPALFDWLQPRWPDVLMLLEAGHRLVAGRYGSPKKPSAAIYQRVANAVLVDRFNESGPKHAKENEPQITRITQIKTRILIRVICIICG